MDALQIISPLGTAAVAALLTAPLASRAALRFGVVDHPNARKVNRREGIPLLGGAAVAVGCAAGMIAFALLGCVEPGERDKVLGFAIGAGVLLVVGGIDDRFELNAWRKLPFQIFAAAIAVYVGFRIEVFTSPLDLTTYILPGWLAWPISLLWIVGVTNAMNLIDGLDGLSAGLGAIIAATLAVICWEAGQSVGLMLSLSLIGALLGYLPFNFPPARSFLGDMGALFIGYTLALASLQGYRKAALLAFIVPLLALAVPLIDTLLSVVRRLRMGTGVFSADRLHIHHRLLEKEGSPRRAVLWLYFQTACFGLIAISFAQLQGYSAFVFLIAVVILTVRLLRNLGLLSQDTAGQEASRATASSSTSDGGGKRE